MYMDWKILVVAVVLAAPARGQNDKKYVRELLTILEQTHSPDAFLVALTQLKEVGASARQVVPCAIRHAERLGIFDARLLNEGDPKARLASAVVAVIGEFGKGKETVAAAKRPKHSSPPRVPNATCQSDQDSWDNNATQRGCGSSSALNSSLNEFATALLDGPVGMLLGVLEPSLTVGITTPLPVSPWGCERIEEKHSGKTAVRTPILPPIRPGAPAPLCEETPDDAEILRALKPVTRGIQHVYEEAREDIQIVKERLLDQVDPPRFFPGVGWAQLHHCHYKCSIYFTETRQSAYPFPFSARIPRREVVYIDKDHLHLVNESGSP